MLFLLVFLMGGNLLTPNSRDVNNVFPELWTQGGGGWKSGGGRFVFIYKFYKLR